MSSILELGQAIHIRRTDMGLTQTALAKLSGLSRATVNQLENGSAADLSLTRASRLLSSLGLSVVISPPRTKRTKVVKSKSSALDIAARTASVSYSRSVTADELCQVITTNVLPEAIQVHMATLLDEAPLSVLAAAVEQVHAEQGLARAQVWKNLRAMATSLKSDRAIWA